MKNLFRKKNRSRENVLNQLSKSNDYTSIQYENNKTGISFQLTYISTLADNKIIQESALPHLLDDGFKRIEDAKQIIPLSNVIISEDPSKIEKGLLKGYVLLTVNGEKNRFCLFAAQQDVVRDITIPEVEYSVNGPKESFVESLDRNLNLLRKRIPAKELIVEELTVGNLSQTKVAILYIEGITNEETVNTVRQRLKDVDYDEIIDSSFIVQMISDNNNSPFPQLLDTERPDRIASVLAEGKVAIMVDGSPQALIGPTTLVEFFSAFEDYFLNWILASFFRLIRLFAVAFSILATPTYVAVLTYHYELIPQDLLNTLVTSRRAIPFPPILEALLLEITIELLREAGARMPTKVGQTIGIVGGVIIGTASVEAGLTSNVLLIFVGLAALASFTTPIYRMGNTIRLSRFPFLLFAQLWGLLGIVLCLCFIITHLIRLTSLGRPILEPIYPPRIQDLKDALIRLPFSRQELRPISLQTEQPVRFHPKDKKEKKDIDE